MTRRALALTLVPATFALAACGGAGDAKTVDGKGPITVTANDSACDVARTEAPAGQIEFTVSNKGTKVNEFYVYAAGDRIMGEVENIAPGLTRTFHVEVAEPGKYETACKPGMVGKGIRSTFTVTGASAAPQTDDAKINAATASYARYVASQSDALLARTTEFVGLVKAGKVDEAKALYPIARSYWERIEPVAESFGDLDPKIDGREDVVEEGMKFTGYHRLEQDLWVKGLQADSNAIADQLLADVTTIVTAGQEGRSSTGSSSPTAPRPCSTRWPRARSPARKSATATPTSGTSPPTGKAPRARSLRSVRSSRSATPPWSRPTTSAPPPSTPSSPSTRRVMATSSTPSSRPSRSAP